MKKNFCLLFVAASFMVACSNQDSVDSEISISDAQENNKEIRTYAEALSIAESSLSMLDKQSVSTRNVTKSRTINSSERKAYTKNVITRGNSIEEDTLIYVFNFEDNDGFALVSASKNTEALLAITDNGNCNPEEKSGNKGFEEFVEMAKEYVANAMKAPILRKPSNPVIETKDSIVYAYRGIEPYLRVNWGQMYPEGEFCKYGIAGCGNTAMAQIMSYFSYPTSINLTYAGADIDTQNLNWPAMRAHATGHTRSSCDDPTTHDAIGRLLRQLGKLNNSHYFFDATTADQQCIPLTFETLGFTCDNWSDYKGLVVRHGLDNHSLFYMIGFSPTGGHAWVLDGYNSVYSTIYHLARTTTSGWFTSDITYETTNYLHFNWGWYGDCNGFFLEGIYDTTQAYSFDNPTNTHNFNLKSNVQVLQVSL